MSASKKVIEAARRLLDQKFSTYKASNGREVGVEGEDGEKVWLVHSNEIFDLETALKKYDERIAKMKTAVATGG